VLGAAEIRRESDANAAQSARVALVSGDAAGQTTARDVFENGGATGAVVE